MSNIDYTLWPNANGNLGEIKVQIPDGVTTTWPEGDALVHNFVFNKGKLVGFVDTKSLIANDSKTTTFPYEYVNISLPSIAEGEMTYNYDQCAYFILNGEVLKGDVPTDEELEIITKKYLGCKTVDDIKAVDPDYLTNDIIDGVWKEGLGDLEQGGDGQGKGGMFYKHTALTSFSSDLSNLMNGGYMFTGCSNLTSFSSDLPNLTNGKWMFYDCSNLTSFTSVSSGSPVSLSSLTDGAHMFGRCTNLTSFSSNLSSLSDGYAMFSDCKNLTSFNADLSSLTDGFCMFQGCTNLISFTSDSNGSPVNLSSLTDGHGMFWGCSQLTSFTYDLSSLTDGSDMFQDCTNLTSFTSDISSLTNGEYMFQGCTNLTSFTYDLSSLTNGRNMFQGCTNLTSFTSDISSLTNGSYMFEGCSLDTASVQNIADTINTASNSKLDIGIGNSSPNEQEEAAFNQMVSKGWIVFVNSNYYGGDESGFYGYTASASLASSVMTLDELGESEMFNPKPYWAKPVNSDEQHAQYTDSEGNFYNILGAQFIYGDNLETYGMFTSLEDAAANMRLKKIGEEEIETA